jgi:hypothetical protein
VASKEIRDYIESKMYGWNGEQDSSEFPRRHALRDWARDWEEFGRRVRRDILVLEKVLVDNKLIDKADLYGDPGDPPPDPEI